LAISFKPVCLSVCLSLNLSLSWWYFPKIKLVGRTEYQDLFLQADSFQSVKWEFKFVFLSVYLSVCLFVSLSLVLSFVVILSKKQISCKNRISGPISSSRQLSISKLAISFNMSIYLSVGISISLFWWHFSKIELVGRTEYEDLFFKRVAWIQTTEFWIAKILDRLFCDRFARFLTSIDFRPQSTWRGGGGCGGGGEWS
jgi:hypothetical protein